MSFAWSPTGLTFADYLAKAEECAAVADALEQAGQLEVAASFRRQEGLWRAVARGAARGADSRRRRIEAGGEP